MPEYGFTGSDIASMASARHDLTAGFAQLGKTIQEDIQRIALNRELKAFGQEMAQLDPTTDEFPQQLLGTLSKYPLASKTPIAQKGIDVLGIRYKAAQEAKLKTPALQPFQIGNVTYDPRIKATYKTDEQGNPVFLDTTPQTSSTPIRGTVVQTPDKQILVDPTTGKTIQEFAPRPASTRSTNLNVLPENVKMQIRFMDEDARAVQSERQKLVDAMTNRKIPARDMAAADKRLKELESQLQNIKDTRAKILMESAGAARPAMPTGGATAAPAAPEPSLMPTPGAQSSFVPMPTTGMPDQSQMVRNEEGAAVAPDQLPVLPDTTTVKEAAQESKRLYQTRGGKILFPRSDYKKAVEQAFADRIITEQRRDDLLRAAP